MIFQKSILRCFHNSFARLSPLPDSKSKESALKWLENLKTNSPTKLLKYFEISYARSSGAGGQHVNTTDSKAILKLSSANWYNSRGKWINELIFDEIMNNYNDSQCPANKKFGFFTNKGDILIKSSKTRYRNHNLLDCLDKFIDSIQKCGEFKKDIDAETIEKWKEYRKNENEFRLKDKRLKKDKKSQRKKINLNDY